MKNKRHSALRTSQSIIAIFFLSSIVGFTSNPNNGTGDGEGSTWIDIVAGIGSFAQVIRDCNGNVVDSRNYGFSNIGASITSKFGVGEIIGKIGTFNVARTSNFSGYPSTDVVYLTSEDLPDVSCSSTYVGAALGINTGFFGLDAGALYFLHPDQSGYYFASSNSPFQPMWRLRLGYEDAWYFSTSFMYNDALLSQGGLFDMGLGFRIKDTKSSIWAGIGASPYYSAQMIVRGTIVPNGWNAAILLSGNIGLGSAATEFGASVGIGMKLQ